MNDLLGRIFDGLLDMGIDVRIVVAVIALLPIAEARIAIPLAIKGGLKPLEAFLYGFLGSSVAVPLLLVALIPLIKKLASSKLFGKIGDALLKRFDAKAQGLNKGTEIKKIVGTMAFVAVPLPLTGVWTGSAVASVLGLKYYVALLSVIGGNLIASAIVTIISITLSEYINIIMAAFAIIALVAALTMLIKALRPKKSA